MLKICRQQWTRANPERKECFYNARVPDSKLKKWICSKCKEYFALSEVDCDHINFIRNTIPKNIDEFLYCFQKLHCPSDCLQILCKFCHRMKTNSELVCDQMTIYRADIRIFLTKLSLDKIDLDELEYKQLKRLHIILNNILVISSTLENKKQKLWTKKYLEFMKGLK